MIYQLIQATWRLRRQAQSRAQLNFVIDNMPSDDIQPKPQHELLLHRRALQGIAGHCRVCGFELFQKANTYIRISNICDIVA